MRLILLSLSVFFLFSATAHAADIACDLPLYDQAQVLNADEEAKVMQAINKLQRNGADVRVRVQTKHSNANLDQYQGVLESECASWQDSVGDRKNNLIVLMVALNSRETGLYYGAEYENRLDDNWNDIQTQDMNPRFRDGDFAKGIDAGLDGVNGAITGEASERSINSDNESPSKPINWDPVMNFLKYLLLFALGLGVCVGVFLIIKNVRRKRAELLAARSALAQLEEEVIAQIMEINDLNDELAVSLKLLQLDPQEKAQLMADYEQLQGQITPLLNAFNDHGDVEAMSLDLTSCETETQLFSKFKASGDEALALINKNLASVNEAKEFAASWNDKKTEFDKTQLQLNESAQALHNKKFITPELDADMNLLSSQIEEFGELCQTQQILKAQSLDKQIQQLASNLGPEIAQWEQTSQVSVQSLDSLQNVLAKQRLEQVDVMGCFGRLRDENPPSVLESIKHVPKALEETLMAAHDLHTQVIGEYKLGQLRAVTRHLEVVNEHLQVAEDLMQEVYSLEAQVKEARDEAPRAQQQLESSLGQIHNYYQNHTSDLLDAHEKKMVDLQQEIDNINLDGDILVALGRIAALQDDCEELANLMQSRVQEQGRLRMQIASLESEYQRLGNHYGVSPNTSSSADLEDQVNALTSAIRTIKRKEQEEEDERRRREASRRRASSSSWSSGRSGRSSGGGGSSSWGSSGRGGGGSSKW